MDVAEIYRSCNLETDLDEFTDFFKYPVKIKMEIILLKHILLIKYNIVLQFEEFVKIMQLNKNS